MFVTTTPAQPMMNSASPPALKGFETLEKHLERSSYVTQRLTARSEGV